MLGAIFVIGIIFLFLAATVRIARREDGHPDSPGAGFSPVIKVVVGILVAAVLVWLAVELFDGDDKKSGYRVSALMGLIAFVGLGLLIRLIPE